MIYALLLALAAPQAAEQAERDFAARAQTEGLWTAFRATAAPEARLFVPEPVRAHDWLKDRKDPLLGYMWWPAEIYLSCDGSVAASTGPSVIGAGRGYFTTVWARETDGGWKWLVDHGAPLEAPRAAGERARVRKARCPAGPPAKPGFVALTMEDREEGKSIDGSLRWTWQVFPDKSRRIAVELWNGARFEEVIRDEVPAA